jgi:hypothetical protein
MRWTTQAILRDGWQSQSKALDWTLDRLDIVRKRAFQVCVGLQPLGLDALQMCEVRVLAQSCGPAGPLVPFHQWWKFATTVKHFRSAGDHNEKKKMKKKVRVKSRNTETSRPKIENETQTQCN